MTLPLFLVTHTYTHRWQGIRLSCLFHYLPLSCCWISWFRLLCCGQRGISLITLAWSFLSYFYLFICILFAFGLPLPSLHSFPLLFYFFCFESVSLSTCCSIVGTEEICHVITPALPVSLVFPALLSKGLQYLVVTSTQKRPNKGFTCLEKNKVLPLLILHLWCSWLWVRQYSVQLLVCVLNTFTGPPWGTA